MSSKLKNKFPLDELARRIEAIRTTNSDGRIAFDGSKFTDLEMVFRTAIDWDESISDYERDRIAFNAPFVAARAGQVTKDALLKAVRELEAKEFAAKPTDYVVVSSSKVEQHIYQLKRYVEELLRLHLIFGRRFPSLSAVGEFFALPPEPAILKERQRIFRQAFDFRQKTLDAT